MFFFSNIQRRTGVPLCNGFDLSDIWRPTLRGGASNKQWPEASPSNHCLDFSQQKKSYGWTESPAHSFTHYHYISCGLYFNIILISLSSTPILSETEYPLRTVCFTALPWDAKLPQLFPPEGTFSFILGLTRKKFPQVFPFHLHFALFASPRGIPRSPPPIPPNPPSFSEVQR